MIILAIGSHHDDLEIGMGGTLLKHRDKGDEIYLAITHADDDLCGNILTRMLEQKLCIEILRAKELLYFEGNAPISKKVKRLDAINPDILYIPFDSDTHQDHCETAKVGFAVSRHTQMTVLRYLSTTSHSCYPNYLSVINIEEKKKLINVFQSQVERRPKFMEVMEAQNRYFGSLIPGNGHYAEGFVLHRMVV